MKTVSELNHGSLHFLCKKSPARNRVGDRVELLNMLAMLTAMH